MHSALHGTQAKRMYVSPFTEWDARYELRVWESATQLTIAIHEFEGDTRALYANIRVDRRPLTDAALMSRLLRDPIVPLRTSALILLHAIHLWRRGVPWHRFRRGARPPSSDAGPER